MALADADDVALCGAVDEQVLGDATEAFCSVEIVASLTKKLYNLVDMRIGEHNFLKLYKLLVEIWEVESVPLEA